MFFDENDHHSMEWVGSHPSGSEEWLCPACGRRILLRWPPHFEKIVLDPGDELATHTGGGQAWLEPLHVDAAAAGSADTHPHPAEPHDSHEPEATDGLDPWLRFFEQFDNDRSG